eukprot:6434325-Lingulodinium_polyedra.AAC.1
MRAKAFSWPAIVITGARRRKCAAGSSEASYASHRRRIAGAAGPRIAVQSSSAMSPSSQSRISGSRRANARA